MTTWIKQGVFGELRPEVAEGLRRLEKLFNHYGLNIFITSIREGVHNIGSLHPSGNAFDIRKPHVELCETIRKYLGAGFDVVNEGDHIHIEYDPK